MDTEILVYFARALGCGYPILESLFCNVDDCNLADFIYKGNVWAIEIMFGRISAIERLNILINSIKCGYGGQLKFILGILSKNDLQIFEREYSISWLMSNAIEKNFIGVCKVMSEYGSLYSARHGVGEAIRFGQVEILKIFIEKDPTCWLESMHLSIVWNSNRCMEFLVNRFADKLTDKSLASNIKFAHDNGYYNLIKWFIDRLPDDGEIVRRIAIESTVNYDIFAYKFDKIAKMKISME